MGEEEYEGFMVGLEIIRDVSYKFRVPNLRRVFALKISNLNLNRFSCIPV